MFDKLKAWLSQSKVKIKVWAKGRLLSRKQLHDPHDPANIAVDAVTGAAATVATNELTHLAEQEAGKL